MARVYRKPCPELAEESPLRQKRLRRFRLGLLHLPALPHSSPLEEFEDREIIIENSGYSELNDIDWSYIIW